VPATSAYLLSNLAWYCTWLVADQALHCNLGYPLVIELPRSCYMVIEMLPRMQFQPFAQGCAIFMLQSRA
jgi:hypothetical protein